MSTLIKLTIILVALAGGTYYWTSADTKNDLNILSKNFQKDTFKKSPLAKDEEAHTQILSIEDASSKEEKEKQDKEEKVKTAEEMEAEVLGEPTSDDEYLVEAASDENLEKTNEDSKKKSNRELETPEKKDTVVAEKKKDDASESSAEETDQLSTLTKEEAANKLPETPNIDEMLAEDTPAKSDKASADKGLSKKEGDILTTAEQPAHKVTKDPFTELLDPSTPQKSTADTETLTENDPDVYADMFEGSSSDKQAAKTVTNNQGLGNLGNPLANNGNMQVPSIDETIDSETSLPKTASPAQPSLSNPLITTDIARLNNNNNTNAIEPSQAPKSIPKEVEENVEIPEALYLPSSRKNADDRIGIKPTNTPENPSEMMDMSEATSSINSNATYPNQVNTPSNRTNNWTNSAPNTMQNNCCMEQNNMSNMQNMNNANNGQNWNNGNYNQNQNGYNNCCNSNMQNNNQMPNNNQQSGNMPQNNGWNSGMNGNAQNNLPTSGQSPKLISGNYKEMTPEEKIATTPFEAIPAGSGTCEFEHVIDADRRTETFRMVVLGTETSQPFKIETKRPLELSKYLTMHIDEIDGYPDEFSSLSVFCKNMRIKKTLVENF